MKKQYFNGEPVFYIGYTTSSDVIYPGVLSGGVLKLNYTYMTEADI